MTVFPLLRTSLPNRDNIKQPSILICDSGVGGLSVYSEVRRILPNAHYLYVFDNEAFPYWEKSEQFIIARIIAIIDAIWRRHKINLIIIACNTASTISLSALRKRFPCQIIGVVPAIKPATQITRNGIIGLLATHATIQRSYTNNLINQYANHCQILQLGTAELVNIAEAKLHGELVSLPVLRKLLCSWLRTKNPPDTVVLGCTHFPLLKQELSTVLTDGTSLVDSGVAIANRAAWLVEHKININAQQDKIVTNKAFCCVITPKVMTLMPVLMRYGFSSLGTLSF